VRVRTRSGFYGVTDEEDKKTSSQSLLAALTSPFNSGEVGLRLTSMLGLDAVFEGKVHSFDPGQQNDLPRLVAGGSFLLGSELQPGEYVLQLIVTGKLAKVKEQLATNWIDFDIVR
jgi:hypothetical protein